jgi:hypothetical protein
MADASARKLRLTITWPNSRTRNLAQRTPHMRELTILADLQAVK